MNAYTVIARRWEHGWELEVRDTSGEEVGTTQSRSLAGADRMARDYIAVLTEQDPAEVQLEILPELPADLAEEVRAAREDVQHAAEIQKRAGERSREVARRLDKVGFTGPEIAAVLDVSKQRVSQLLAGAKG